MRKGGEFVLVDIGIFYKDRLIICFDMGLKIGRLVEQSRKRNFT